MAYSFVRASTQSLTIVNAKSTYNFIETTGIFACSLWFKLTSSTENAANTFIDSNDSSTNLKGIAIFQDNRSSVPSVKKIKTIVSRGVSGSPVVSIDSADNAITDTNWHNVVLTSNGSNATLYLDGSSIGTAAIGTLSSGNSSNDLKIGGNARLMNGYLAEIAIWDIELNTAEISGLAKGIKPNKIRPSSLSLYAPIIRNLIDYNLGLSITNNNSSTVVNHPRVY